LFIPAREVNYVSKYDNAQQSLITFRSAATKSFSSFLGSVAGVHLEKQRARNDAVSALTDGVLCSSAAMHASLTASNVVCTSMSPTV